MKQQLGSWREGGGGLGNDPSTNDRRGGPQRAANGFKVDRVGGVGTLMRKKLVDGVIRWSCCAAAVPLAPSAAAIVKYSTSDEALVGGKKSSGESMIRQRRNWGPSFSLTTDRSRGKLHVYDPLQRDNSETTPAQRSIPDRTPSSALLEQDAI